MMRPRSADDEQPPGAVVAETILAAFREELGSPEYQVDDAFFRSGGDSLAAMRVLARLQARHDIRLSLADVFACGTPAALAVRVEQLRAQAPPRRRSILASARRHRETFPLALSQQSFYDMDRATRGAPFFNNVCQLRFSGDVDVAAIRAALGDLVDRQAALRTVFAEDAGGPVQRLLDQPPRITEVDLRGGHGDGGAADQRLRRLAKLEYLRGFDLHAEPPARFTIARTGDDSWTVVSTVHHIVFDGESRAVVVDDLAHAYRCRTDGAAPRPALRHRYVDFAEWQRDTVSGDQLADALEQLRDTLREPSPVIAPAGGGTGYRSRIEPLSVAPDVAAGLDATALRHGTTPFVVLIAGLLEFGRRTAGGTRQLVAVQAANRSWEGSSVLVGCFANTLCVAADLEAATTPHDAVRAAHEAVVQALRIEHVPLDHALTVLAEQGHDLVGKGHLPQLGFTMNSEDRWRVDMPGCTLTAAQTWPDEESLDPTTFPLVVELTGGRDRLEGLTHRLVGAWPGDSYATAARTLLASIRHFSGIPAEDGQR